MELVEFIDRFYDALRKNACITFFCQCEIDYDGRAQSHLSRGDRILIIKADNTLLIHQPESNNPVNYMKPGTAYELERIESHLLLKAKNLDLKEFMNIEIYRIYDCITHVLEDGQKLELAGNEKQMSDMIKENPALISKDFKPVSREEHTKFGFIDVFGHDGKGNLVIVECKRYVGSLKCVSQLRRYVEMIKELKGTDKVQGVLASPDISSNAFEMLKKWGFEWKKVDPPKHLERYKKDQKTLGDW